MKQIRLLLLFTFIAVSLGITQDQPSTAVATEAPQSSAAPVTHSQATDAPAANSQASTAMVNAEAQSSSIRILTPVAGQTLTSNFVDLRFEVTHPVLSGEPNFLVQLDSSDPINMTETNYTFSSLQPGIHTVRVTLVDANNSPVQGGAATVQFKVPSVSQPAHVDGSRGTKQREPRAIAGLAPGAPIPPELRNDGDLNLPLAGSPLPILSLIGFGLLIGGAAQTMRSR
jgi:hypothetical protein